MVALLLPQNNSLTANSSENIDLYPSCRTIEQPGILGDALYYGPLPSDFIVWSLCLIHPAERIFQLHLSSRFRVSPATQ